MGVQIHGTILDRTVSAIDMADVCRKALTERKNRAVLSGGYLEEFSGTFVVARDAGANGEIRAAVNKELRDLGVHAHEVGQRVEDRRLTADTVSVDVGAGVHVGAAVEQEARGVEETVFSGDVEEGCASEKEQAAARGTAIELGVAPVQQRRIGTEERGQFVGAAAEDREHARQVVTRARSGGEESLDAGGVPLRVARICPKNIVQCGVLRFVRNAAIRIGAMVEQPLEGFRLEVLTRVKEHREPAHAEPVDVSSVSQEKLHHRNSAGLRRHDASVVAHNLTECRVGCQKFFDAQNAIACDRMFQLASKFKRLDVLLEPGPACEAVLSGDEKLCGGKRGGGAGTDGVFGLIAEMAEVGTIGKLHGRNPSMCPVSA